MLPVSPPSLSHVRELIINFETTGLRWWAGDRPLSAAYRLPDGTTGYLAWGHKSGNNISEDAAKRWFEREVRDLHILNINTRFEVHMAREWGIDLESQNCTVSDVAHYAALLDDSRYRFSLDILASDILGVTPMARLDERRMVEYSAQAAAPRAIHNVELVHQLRNAFWPRLEAEDLQRVRALEDQIIFAVCEMEKNASPIDEEKLHRWRQEAEQRYLHCLYEIARETGIKFGKHAGQDDLFEDASRAMFNPDKSDHWERLFHHLKIPVTEHTALGRASFTDGFLRRVAHPIVQLGRRAGKLADLRSKYLEKYAKALDGGKIRYALHQLRNDDGGTITGRFSSAALIKGDPKSGINTQQVMAVEKQKEQYGPDFIIRELFIPGSGFYTSSDAAQIEYRMFASYVQTRSVIEAYKRNPTMSFHKFIHGLIRPHKPDLPYKQLKNLNFAKIYGAGLPKIALMLDFITEEQFTDLYRRPKTGSWEHHPLLRQAAEVDAIYSRELPEVRHLLKRVADRAERVGFVRTWLGRRIRFPHRERLHKALNGIIQGGAADIMKMKIVQLHRERRRLGITLRITNHDEVCGDCPNIESAWLVDAVLNHQDTPFAVPILWETDIGDNWAQAQPLSKRERAYPATKDDTRPGNSPSPVVMAEYE